MVAWCTMGGRTVGLSTWLCRQDDLRALLRSELNRVRTVGSGVDKDTPSEGRPITSGELDGDVRGLATGFSLAGREGRAAGTGCGSAIAAAGPASSSLAGRMPELG
mmetsp:Transcript_31746/g.83159  ORF Transcript_31746/g.83159 Transcript_31746/m.83159 type:complete len:106 (+) Transcript_31746:693-1010(+)